MATTEKTKNNPSVVSTINEETSAKAGVTPPANTMEQPPVSSNKGDGATKSTNVGEKPQSTSVGGYEALLEEWQPKPMTKEELDKEAKRHRRQQIFNAIGDGIMALSNLYFTTKGAPNMYNGKNTLSERAQVRYDKLMKDNDAKLSAFTNGKIKARQADEEKAHRERSWKRLLGLDKDKRDAAKAKADQDKALWDLEIKFNQGKIDEQAYKTEQARIKSEYAARVEQSVIDKNNAAAGASRASAEKYRKESKGEFIAYDADGKAHYFKNKDAAEAFARQNNTWEDISTTSTQEKSKGKSKTTTTTTKVTSGRAAKPKKKNPML